MLFLLFGHDPRAEAVRCTLNTPAVRSFFPEATEVAVAVRNGGVWLAPAARSADGAVRDGSTVARLEPRSRGGAELVFSPEQSAAFSPLMSGLLRPDAERPYYLLHQEADGWFGLRHFDQPGDPPRTQPHMRVWKVARPSLAPTTTDTSYAEGVRNAAAVLTAAGRRVGRRGQEVEAARKVMAEFTALVREVAPHLLMPKLDVASLRSTADALLRLADHAEHANG